LLEGASRSEQTTRTYKGAEVKQKTSPLGTLPVKIQLHLKICTGDNPVTEHRERWKTIELVTRNYW